MPGTELKLALDNFHSVDWTFEHSQTTVGLHGIHSYPAKFIPQLPRHLLRIFHPIVGGSVLDPFCGSGTTLLESQRAGIESIGIDLNPIATLMSTVKTSPPRVPIVSAAVQMLESAQSSLVDIPQHIPRLDHWFSPGAAKGLARLTHQLSCVSDSSVYNALKLAISKILVRVSYQDSETRYAAIPRYVSESDVYQAFLEAVRSLEKVFLKEHSDFSREWAPCTVMRKDILQVCTADLPSKVGLVITSPPYPNAFEYWLYNKYRMYWLGEDPLIVRDLEIGARPHYFRKSPATVADFRNQMSSCFSLFRDIALPTSIVCMVIGRSIIKGEVIDNASLIKGVAYDQGFEYLVSATRRIPRSRKAFNPTHGNIDTETVLVFLRKET